VYLVNLYSMNVYWVNVYLVNVYLVNLYSMNAYLVNSVNLKFGKYVFGLWKNLGLELEQKLFFSATNFSWKQHTIRQNAFLPFMTLRGKFGLDLKAKSWLVERENFFRLNPCFKSCRKLFHFACCSECKISCHFYYWKFWHARNVFWTVADWKRETEKKVRQTKTEERDRDT